MHFREVWALDFEFTARPGERPDPICLVARELGSGRTVHIWEDELRQRRTPPYPTDHDCLLVAYYASAEIGCHLALSWPIPNSVLDLFVEFRNLTNGRSGGSGNGLLGALLHFGIDAMDATDKEAMRALAIRGGPWTATERAALLAYCASDVIAVENLFPRMLPRLDIERALLRGRYMIAAAHMEHTGVPIDTDALVTLVDKWEAVQDGLIARINATYGVYAGRTFKTRQFAQWLSVQGIAWPQLPSGALALDNDTFREMGRRHPAVEPLRQLRMTLSQLRLHELAVGRDGRNRCLLSAFRTKTGRNAPSNSRFIFGLPAWLRSLIRPAPDTGLAYIDWEQQEFGIAAALSGDGAMVAAYESGDPYLTFARQAGAAPTDATKASHKGVRELFKMCALAVQYGMGAETLGRQIGQDPARAHELLRLHRTTYPQFWRWSDAVVDYASLNSTLYTTFGWTLHVGVDANARSLRNFPMQANGAEMLRLACCFATERGIRVCAPVHDAILVEAPLAELKETVGSVQEVMAQASSVVLDGFRLRSDVKIITPPDRYNDARGQQMWATVWDLIAEVVPPGTCAPAHPHPAHPCNATCAPAPTRLFLCSPLLSL